MKSVEEDKKTKSFIVRNKLYKKSILFYFNFEYI